MRHAITGHILGNVVTGEIAYVLAMETIIVIENAHVNVSAVMEKM